MKKLILLLSVVFIGCNNQVKYTTPLWVNQNIDSVNSCNIIPCDRIKIIEVGNSYTATWDMGDGIIYFKADNKKDYVDFGTPEMAIGYYTDSCGLKEDLRNFIKIQIVAYKSEHFKQELINKMNKK